MANQEQRWLPFVRELKATPLSPLHAPRDLSGVSSLPLAFPTSSPCDATVDEVEISVRGQWTRVPALRVKGNVLIVRGKLIKTAVLHDEEWLATELEDPELCVQALKEQGRAALHADIFTFSQKLPETQPKFPYPLEWDSVAAVRVGSFEEWWEKLPQESRKNLRRSQKRGVVVQVKRLDDRLIVGIVGVNNDSPMRQNIPFAHYGKNFDRVSKDQSSFLDRSDFICAYLGNELIGFLKLVYRGKVASILQLLTKFSHADKRPANVLLTKAVELCEAKRIGFLTYGRFNYGNKRNSSLRTFKVRNGFEEILVPRYFVPLTLWGASCIKMRLHQGLHGVLPEHAIATFVKVRAQAYKLVNLLGRCSLMVEQPNRNRETERSNPPAGSKI